MKNIIKEIKEGSVEGYITINIEENIKNFLFKNGFKKEYPLISNYSKVAILKNLNVDEKFRNNNFGNYLLDFFIKESIKLNAELILLVADTGENNEFNLVEWYENNNFKIISSGSNPLMCLSFK